jgi:hypothetical protein
MEVKAAEDKHMAKKKPDTSFNFGANLARRSHSRHLGKPKKGGGRKGGKKGGGS